MAAPRIMRDAYTRIGWLATSGSRSAMWRTLNFLGTSPGHSRHGKDDATHLELASEDGKTFQALLTDNAALELVKGVLLIVLEHRGGQITMTADDEFRNVLQQCEAAIRQGDAEAAQIVAAVRRGPQIV